MYYIYIGLIYVIRLATCVDLFDAIDRSDEYV